MSQIRGNQIITNDFNATGSFSGSFNGTFSYAVYNNIILRYPIEFSEPAPEPPNSVVFGSTIYVITIAQGDPLNPFQPTDTVPLTFSNPANYLGQRAVVINVDQDTGITVSNDNGYAPKSANNSVIANIAKRSVVEFISTGNFWYQL